MEVTIEIQALWATSPVTVVPEVPLIQIVEPATTTAVTTVPVPLPDITIHLPIMVGIIVAAVPTEPRLTTTVIITVATAAAAALIITGRPIPVPAVAHLIPEAITVPVEQGASEVATEEVAEDKVFKN